MKYPMTAEYGPAGWCVKDAEGVCVAYAYNSGDANAIRDAMNKCTPAPLEDRHVEAFDCWGYALGIKSKPFNAEADQGAAVHTAEMLGTRPVRGRFIPDGMAPKAIYAEVARLLMQAEPAVGPMTVEGSTDLATFPIEYEADEHGTRVVWSPESVETLVVSFRDKAEDHCEDQHHDWAALDAEYRRGADADARCSDAD